MNIERPTSNFQLPTSNGEEMNWQRWTGKD